MYFFVEIKLLWFIDKKTNKRKINVFYKKKAFFSLLYTNFVFFFYFKICCWKRLKILFKIMKKILFFVVSIEKVYTYLVSSRRIKDLDVVCTGFVLNLIFF